MFQSATFRATSIVQVCIAIAITLSFAGLLGAAPFVAFDQANGIPGNQTGGPYDLGSYFTVNKTIEVRDLGAFDSTGTGLASSVFVSIYKIGNTTPLISESLTASNTHSVAGSSYVFANTGTILDLAPGNYMVVGSNFGATTAVDNNTCCAGGVNPIINTGGGSLSFPTFGSQTASQYGSFNTVTNLPTYPTTPDGSTYLAGTFTFVNTPEPSSLLLAGLGAIGLFIAARRRRNA